jgi:hypothetical protein
MYSTVRKLGVGAESATSGESMLPVPRVLQVTTSAASATASAAASAAIAAIAMIAAWETAQTGPPRIWL